MVLAAAGDEGTRTRSNAARCLGVAVSLRYLREVTRSYDQLLSDDPAWPTLRAELTSGTNDIVILPPGADREACLVRLQVTTRSNLGAVAHETGGLLVDGGFVRLFGAGSERLPRALGAWNESLGIEIADALVIGDDAVGGVFAIDGGALGNPGLVHYFSPDSLDWENLDVGHSGWLGWIARGDLAKFYGDLRWPGWQADVAALAGDCVLSAWPPPWTKEGKDPASVSRRAVPAKELFDLMMDLRDQLASR